MLYILYMIASGERENYIEVVTCKFFIQKLEKGE